MKRVLADFSERRSVNERSGYNSSTPFSVSSLRPLHALRITAGVVSLPGTIESGTVLVLVLVLYLILIFNSRRG